MILTVRASTEADLPAITAIARELCAFLWELHVKVLPAHPVTR